MHQANDGALVDVVVSSVGRDLFGRMIDLLGPGGRLVFYGATTGYTLAFLGKPGSGSAREMYRRADLRPHEGVVVYRVDLVDPVADDAIEVALATGARVVAVTPTDVQVVPLRERFAVQGVVSLETLAREGGLRWPHAMPDYDQDLPGYRAYQDFTLKPFGQAIGRLLATSDNPRGNPDVIVERAGQDTLGVSTFVARPHTGRIVYLEGYLFDRPEAKAAFRQAADLAAKAGRQVALTLSDAFCVDRHRAEFLELVRNSVDILFANESEVASLYQTTSFEEAARRAQADTKLAALTR